MDTDIHTRRTSCDDEDRDWGGAHTSQGTQNITGKPPEARELWNRCFFMVPRKNQLS